jgi:hypothetical protein
MTLCFLFQNHYEKVYPEESSLFDLLFLKKQQQQINAKFMTFKFANLLKCNSLYAYQLLETLNDMSCPYARLLSVLDSKKRGMAL